MSEPAYAGEVPCSKPGCKRVAYYIYPNSAGSPRCGHHCKSCIIGRRPLPRNPNAAKLRDDRIAAHRLTLGSGTGAVSVGKLHMMRNPDLIDGVLFVFPNYRHGGRKDGLGCPDLSPMSLGPILTWAGVAQNIENFHQCSKIFPHQTLKQCLKQRAEGWSSAMPQRHAAASRGGRIKCTGFVWTRQDGTHCTLSYVECRQFYCRYMEKARETASWQRLTELRANGTDLRIMGYDGYMPADIDAAYLDDQRPFGHELVLYTMLVRPDPESWPWRKHATETMPLVLW